MILEDKPSAFRVLQFAIRGCSCIRGVYLSRKKLTLKFKILFVVLCDFLVWVFKAKESSLVGDGRWWWWGSQHLSMPIGMGEQPVFSYILY